MTKSECHLGGNACLSRARCLTVSVVLCDSGDHFSTPEIPKAYTVIIGAGAVGITLAHALEASGVTDVLVLEAGGDVPEDSASLLFEAPSVGIKYDTSGTRYRGLGGATNLWARWCKPMDAEEWSSGSLYGGGQPWPFPIHELEGWYKVAAEDLALGDWDWSPDSVAQSEGKSSLSQLAESKDLLESVLWRFAPEPPSFAERYFRFIRDGKTPFVLNAPVTSLDIDGGRVRTLQVLLESGYLVKVRCRSVVLAAGGLENVRMLLTAEESLQEEGFALDLSGWLGHGWQEHPHVPVGGVLIPQGVAEGYLWLHSDRRICSGVETLAGFKIPPPSRHWRVKLPVSITLEKLYRPDDYPLAHGIQELLESARGEPSIQRVLYARSEAQTLYRSEVRLGESRDSLGLRQINLDWQLHSGDIENLVESGRHLAHAFATLDLGVVHPDLSTTRVQENIIGGAHHIGGARMSKDPAEGVTSSFGALHTVPNLFVTGSALFPSGGYSNPTLTILALTYRLANHLITLNGSNL